MSKQPQKMKYLSVCSGIEAASVAWHPLGWSAVAVSEIDTFPSHVLAHHFPTVPNWGDMTRFHAWPDATVDVLVGGTPCQSFSVAGLRKGLADPRGSLLLTYLAIADRYRPRWLVWENVPGVLSADDGRAFGSLLGGLAELGYGFAYRVLDAQYFNLAQRRARVFVVGHLGDWRRAAAVLFERASLSGHPAPSREARQDVAGPIAGCSNGGGANGPGRTADDACSLIAHTLRADGYASEDGTGRGTPLVPITLAIRGRGDSHDLEYRQDGTANAILTPNGGRGGIGVGAVAFHENQRAECVLNDTAGALKVGGGKPGQGYPAVIAFGVKDYGQDAMSDVSPTLRAGESSTGHESSRVFVAGAMSSGNSSTTSSTGIACILTRSRLTCRMFASGSQPPKTCWRKTPATVPSRRFNISSRAAQERFNERSALVVARADP